MSLDFLVEIIKPYPTFSCRVSSDEQTVSIFENIETEIVLSGSHRDRNYNSKTENCVQLDCSEFYSSAVSSGAVSLCGDCEDKVTPNPPKPPLTCSQWNFLSKYLYDESFGKPQRVVDTATYNSYISWFTSVPGQEQLKNFLSKSGYWLGLPVCTGDGYQCLVDCAGGIVSGCWNTSKYGTASFGDVYDINGTKYQVYDPVQILLAGLTPSGGSFTLLSSNPVSDKTSSGKDCDRPYTKLTDARSCLVSQEKPQTCEVEEYQPKEGQNPNWANKAISGDFTGKSILSEGECYLVPTESIIQNSWALSGSLGGNLDLGRFDDPPLLIQQVIENCGACLTKLLEDNSGPSCCQVSFGKITVRDAPSWDGSDWTSGGETWDNFWGNDEIDDSFRVDELCADPSNSGSCSWRSSCNEPNDGELANALGTIPCSSKFNQFVCDDSKLVVGQKMYYTCGNFVGKDPIFTNDCTCNSGCVCEQVLPKCASGEDEYFFVDVLISCQDWNPLAFLHTQARSEKIPQDGDGSTKTNEENCFLRGGLSSATTLTTTNCLSDSEQTYGNKAVTCCGGIDSSFNTKSQPNQDNEDGYPILKDLNECSSYRFRL